MTGSSPACRVRRNTPDRRVTSDSPTAPGTLLHPIPLGTLDRPIPLRDLEHPGLLGDLEHPKPLGNLGRPKAIGRPSPPRPAGRPCPRGAPPLPTGLGWALVFTPSLGTVGRYFPAQRALATGLVVSGASVSGLALGPLVPLLLDTYGWRGALLLLAAISFNLVAAGALLRPLPVPGEAPGPPRDRPGLLRLLRHGPFIRYALAFVLVDAGYYVPFVHGEARAHEVGCDEHRAGLVMAAMAAVDGGGRVAAGWLAARPATPLLRHLFAWAVLTGLVLLLLPLGTSFGGLLALASAYGFCAGAVVPLQFAGVAEVVGAGRLVHAIGLMQMFESFGSLLGAPFAGMEVTRCGARGPGGLGDLEPVTGGTQGPAGGCVSHPHGCLAGQWLVVGLGDPDSVTWGDIG